jgi:hypothetical protein
MPTLADVASDWLFFAATGLSISTGVIAMETGGLLVSVESFDALSASVSGHGHLVSLHSKTIVSGWIAVP